MSNIAIKVFHFYQLRDPFSIDFWRRGLFSSAFLRAKLYFWATRPFLVAILKRETPFFDDEIHSRRHFEP
ncbi:hypothetical protein LI012_14975, partial [Caldibacillus thermoamylovorans]|nr:hypothetical protein [Caldibacillus thermoamylovorans]